MSDDLPMGWVETELGEIFEFNPRHSSSIDRSINVSFVPMPSVCEHNGIILPHSTKKLEEVWKGYTHFQNDDVIFAKITPCMENGKIALASNLHNDIACGSTEFHVLRSLGAVLPLYVWYFLRQRSFLRDAEQRMTGAVGQRRVPVNFLKETHLAIPPLNEQRRIVDKLERIGDRHRTARNELNHIPKLIARYKQSVLAAATSGEDSEDWQNVDIQSVAKVGTGSTPLKSNSGYYADTGTPWITSAATSQPFVSKASGFVTDSAILDCRLKKYPVGTILVAMYGEGKTRGQVTELAIEATINQACAAIMVDESLACKEYVKLSLQANYLQMRELAEGGNQPNLNLSKIKTFPLFLPPIEEQKEIVRRVEKMFEKIDRMEEEYQQAAKLCDRLEQATLAKAFRGELVPQDPDDEPASVLLEQVKREKEKGKKVRM